MVTIYATFPRGEDPALYIHLPSINQYAPFSRINIFTNPWLRQRWPQQNQASPGLLTFWCSLCHWEFFYHRLRSS
uniref:Uncharacterized protein n=1 Tax=Arundo donax TaxID=35708 RepID=A0A0A9GXE7_ARUDO